jgi:hypothetical protein
MAKAAKGHDWAESDLKNTCRIGTIAALFEQVT